MDGRTSVVIPTLSQAAEAYIAAQKLTWFRSSIKDISPQINQFVAIVSELERGRRDVLLTQLSRDHIRRYYDAIRNLPHRINGKKEFRQKTWLNLADLGRNGFARRLLSEKTLTVRQNNIRSFINWCELEYQGLIQARYINTGFPKAVTDSDVRRKGVHREAFTPDELRALFGDMDYYRQSTEDSPSKYWSPLGSGLINWQRVKKRLMEVVGEKVMSDLFYLSTEQLERLRPYFPLSPGVARVDGRKVISGIIYVIRNGLMWKDAPVEYGPPKPFTTDSYAGAIWECSAKYSPNWPLKPSMTSGL